MSIFQQLEQLRSQHPRIALMQVNCENSPYVNFTGNSKNCYLLIGSEYDQDCYYGYFLYNSQDSVDCDYCFNCELCYDCVDCHRCYNCQSCQDCKDGRDLEYCFDLIGSHDCFGCVGLRRKEYHLFNQRYDRETYLEKVKLARALPREEIESRVEALKRQIPRVALRGENNDRSFGDYLYNTKECYTCFDVKKLQDCAFMNNSEEITDSMDCSNNYYNSQLNYEVMAAMNITNCNYCYGVFDSYDLEYCEMVYGSHHLFGCFSLKGKSYCIFNQQYSPEEWTEKVAQIKSQMKAEGIYGKHLPTTYPEIAVPGL